MATHDRINTVAPDEEAIELEAMRKDDSSWHPCQVSLSSSGVGLIVDYGNTDSEDIIVNEEEAIARLRIRSIPLHGDDCVHIEEGEHILATQKSQSKSLFFDAKVEKVTFWTVDRQIQLFHLALRVRHSKKIYCRCNFIIKWLHQDRGGTLTVPSSSIKKLATTGINVNPTICAFLNTLKNLSCSSTPPLPTIVEDIDCEMDLHKLLEKQIEEISNSADVSKKRISDNILFGVEVDNKGQIQCRAVAGSKVSKSHVQVPPDQNHLKRTTRSTKKLQMEMEVKDPPPSAPSIQELSESRSPLNPLAARAALASLMSKMPQNLEVSFYREEKLDYTYSLNGTKLYKSPTRNSFSLTDKLPLQAEATSVPFDPDINSASGKPQLMNASSGILTMERESEDKTSEIHDSRESFTCSVAKRKLIPPPKATNLTDSVIEKGAGIPDRTIERKTCVEQKLQSSTNPRRFTRSAVGKVKEAQTMEAKQGMEDYKSGKFADSGSVVQNIAVLESQALKDEKLATSRNDSAVKLLSTEDRNSLGKEEEGNKKHVVERKTRAGLRNSTSQSSLTHSAVHEEKGNKTTKATDELEDDKLAQNTRSNSSKENVTACKSTVVKTTEWTSSPLEAEGDLPLIDKRHNRGKMSSAVKTTQKTEGKVAGNGESCRSLKRKSTTSKSQESRFSARLRFSPRTRSQHNS
ncbi:uncharacterized protein LOC114283407 isoform X2 [Camellia sinensis]|uniref:uncharacterized protein LOC114283407 isoform X2 n=1 Tax=Camellia sinensis TaxID=4442 RepID=UPI001036C12A|nr:uncharacterized protein LOC114283407 isoform X2 [Camellia sinensis]